MNPVDSKIGEEKEERDASKEVYPTSRGCRQTFVEQRVALDFAPEPRYSEHCT